MLFSTIGIFVSRYIKKITKESDVVKSEMWIVFHAAVMLVCTACVVTGFALVFVEVIKVKDLFKTIRNTPK